MSADPQLRCLLCDLILAEDGSAQPSEGCRQCGRRIAAGQRQGDAGGEVLPLTTIGRPKSLDPATVEIPLHPPAPASPLDDDIPVAAVVRKPTADDIPTGPPARRTTTGPTDAPYTAKRVNPAFPNSPPTRPVPPPPARRPTLPDPPKPTAPPRPQVIRALGVLGCMGLLAAIAVVVLVYCVVVGLKMGVKKSEATPTMTQPAVG